MAFIVYCYVAIFRTLSHGLATIWRPLFLRPTQDRSLQEQKNYRDVFFAQVHNTHLKVVAGIEF